MRRKNIEVSKEKRNHMISSIQNYFCIERNEDLGDLAASLVLDYIIDNLAPEFYNQGVYDSYKYMNDSIEELLGIVK